MAEPIRSFTVDALSVRIYANAGDLVSAAAAEAQRQLAEALHARGAASAILATGNSQLRFLDELIRLGGVDWSRVTLFHMDEYLGMNANHPASFRRYMRERVEWKVRPKVFHYLAGDALEPIKECERYERLLRAQPIDLCCLGIGENGHLAFNDPPVADFKDARWVKIVALDEVNRKQQTSYGHFKSLDEVPRYGLTLTIPALLSATKVLCLAPEKRKAPPVKETLKGSISPACPASAMRNCSRATLLLDPDSAALL
jgi:glucosamine-6-phosphate deaminase